MVRGGAPTDPGQVVHLPTGGEPPYLLRIPVTSPTWAEQLPPMPDGAGISVAFSDPDTLAEHEDAVALLGYRTVGVAGGPAQGTATIDLLIPRAAVDRWPVWRDGVLAAGGQVWDLGLGPVAALMSVVVAVHR